MSLRPRVAVLCAVEGLYATARLHEAASRLGWEPTTVNPGRVVLRATPSPGVFEDGAEIPAPDALIPRLTGASAAWGRAVLATWAARGVPCPVTAEALATAQDKLSTALRLHAAGVPTLPTAALREPRHADEALLGLVDDILDCTASTATLGKTAGKDEAAEKPTYVSLLGLDAARAYADELRSDALAALLMFGERATRLTQLADFICHRQF